MRVACQSPMSSFSHAYQNATIFETTDDKAWHCMLLLVFMWLEVYQVVKL